MASISRVIYVGFTDTLIKRIFQHKQGTYENAFSKKYKTNKLVYWEHYHSMKEALERERQIKSYRREKKTMLIEECNPSWRDLYADVVELHKAWLTR